MVAAVLVSHVILNPPGVRVCSEGGPDPSSSFGGWRHLTPKEKKEAQACYHQKRH